jgi:molybdopterin converting factor small subunit
MPVTKPATVKTIAFLATFRSDRGLPTTELVDVPQTGETARQLAAVLGLPLDRVEGVFLNHRTAGLDAVVRPGDRVAFVPYGTPASHPAFFGPFTTRV